MVVKILLISSLVGTMGMIALTKAIPIEVVYTGDSCDCPKSLNYLVNIPPPPKPYDYKTSEHGYKLDVPVQAKTKVTYSFDFTVQEPKIPPPAYQEKLNLYAKVDRITAHKKDCISTYGPLPKNCGCIASRKYEDRYVSPENRAIRNVPKYHHPNSISKNMPSTSKVLAIFLQPLDQSKSIGAKSRNKRDISKIFLRPRKNDNAKRSGRLVKQYNKRLKSQTENIQLFGETPKTPKPITPVSRRALENLKNLLMPPHLRNKRDIKGEYDLIEKERDQMDLTLPEIIQYMPETLDPNFKRGQCQFSRLCQKTEGQEEVAEMDYASNMTKENTKETLENINNDDTSNDDMKENDNAISSTHTKRNAAHYDCGLTFNHQLTSPTPAIGYALEPYAPPPVSPNYDALPRPFSVTSSPFGVDPAPQQYVGAPYSYVTAPPTIINSPIVGATYNPYGPPQGSYAQLDQIIAEIVNRHPEFIEASTHQGGSLVDPSKEQVYQTKSLLKTLIEGHFQKLFTEEPIDSSYSYGPNYRAAAPAFAPPQPY